MNEAQKLCPWTDGDPWWAKYWDELCPNGTKEEAELRLWALDFYGLSGVEADLEYLKDAKRRVERDA